MPDFILAAAALAAAPLLVSVATIVGRVIREGRRHTAKETQIRDLQVVIANYAYREGIDLELTQDEIRDQIRKLQFESPDLNITVKADGGPKDERVHQ